MTTSRKVHFNNCSIDVVSDLYLPSSIAPDRKRAAIVVGHPGTGIKEQVSGLYARLLADNGFITLAFDAAYQGESSGEPRNLEDPYQRAEDFKSATSFLSTLHDEVDPERIRVVGICASGGYGIFAAQTDIRMKAVAGVVAMCIEAKGEQPIMTNILDTMPEAAEYYKTPVGYHPRCTNEQLVRSVELMLNYDSFAFIDWISPRPLLMIIGTGRHKVFNTTPYSVKAYECAKEPKEVFTVEGKKRIDLCSDTSEGISKLVEFMNKWLYY